jgi:metal-responsive CopG/Arc/MetJ family transcriptional regulator
VLTPFAGKNPDFAVQLIVLMPVLPVSASRLEVRLPDRLSERLESLASSEGLTKTDVFRRALALYLLVKEREEAGATLQFVKNDQRETLVSI